VGSDWGAGQCQHGQQDVAEQGRHRTPGATNANLDLTATGS
jgi:hypothetical protein